MKTLEKFETKNWNTAPAEEVKKRALLALESGKVLFFPKLEFEISEEEKKFLNSTMVDPKAKNVSYNCKTALLLGSLYQGEEHEKLKAMLQRFAASAKLLLENLIPPYRLHLVQARTSFRPVEIHGRKTSLKKDDTRLHVDAFPSTPTCGTRILRVFANINPHGKPRVWRIGEPFEQVVEKMAPKISHPVFGMAQMLKLLRITKKLRTPYDHYMLQIHDKMKEDEDYQLTVRQEEIQFPAGSSWMVFTDQVSHAAMSGQYVLEQTFHIPVEGIQHLELTPLKVLEKHFEKTLI